MSKAKKIISMLLVVVMALTMAPVSGFAALADQGYEYATPTLTPTTFTVDTSETTEVTRVAAGHHSFSLPDGTAEAPITIVAATPSGIPKASATSRPEENDFTGDMWGPIAYAGEIPVMPKLVFKMTGAVPDELPVVTPNVTGVNIGSSNRVVNGDTVTYTFEYKSGDTGMTSGAGTDLVFKIEYKVSGVEYTSYAYSHVENIIVMNGFAQYRHRKDSDNYTRHSMIGQYQSHNMYTRMNGANLEVSTGTETDPNARSVSNRKIGYINYASAFEASGGAILGCGSEKDLSAEANAYGSQAPNGAIPGYEQPALIKGNNTENKETRNICTDNDTNRGEPVIYLDAGQNETFDSINFRFTLQGAEHGDFAGATLNSFRFVMPGANDLADDCAISNEIYDQTGTPIPSTQISVKGLNYGSEGNATVNASNYTSYAMAKFGGPGPAANSSLDDNYTVFASWNTAEKNQGPMQTTGGMNFIIRRYNTADLRELYNGVMTGKGSVTFDVTSGLTGSLALNKGVNPQAGMYNINSTDRNGTAYQAGQTDWTMFETALKTAGSLLARPDLNQTQIDNATKALREAYLNLEGYSDTYYVEIWHCRAGTNGTEADVITAKDGTKLIQKVNGGNPIASGQSISTRAATISGYEAIGETVQKTPVSGKVNPETGTNKVIIRYYYQPKDVNINVAPNNPGMLNYMQTVKFDSTVDLTAKDESGNLIFNYGEREHYTFAGWLNSVDSKVYDVLSPNGTKSFTMPDKEVTLNGQWKITPLKVIGVPVTNKGATFEGKQLGEDIVLADEMSTVSFAEPTKYVSSVSSNGTKTYKDGRYLNDGYLFGGYYENYDAATQTFSNPVSWPLSFSFGDSDKTVYIRWIDVNGTVSFETNGGNEIDDITYSTTPAEIVAPATPTKAGYDFVQWHSTEALNSPILADDGSLWTEGKVKTQQTQTGFLAYAEWTAQRHTIKFNMGNATSDFDTTTAQMPTLVGFSDSPVNPDDIPPAPTKYGKVFAQWVIQGTNTVYKFDKYPKQDIVLVPVWNDTPYSAFVSIGAYEKLATGESVLVAPTSTEPGSAQAGDVVTFRMTSLTNFYNGSSVFVFMYDKNFYELVAEGTDAFVLNSENEYVAGIEASAYGVTNDATLSKLWPAELTEIREDYNAMMVTIDPTVSSGNYNCEPMSDGKWLVEFQLKVKETATEGDSGTVYMSNEWTRTADNIMGTMFYGWAESGEDDVGETFNNVVTPNLDKATATIQIDPTPVTQTTVTLDPNGGMWADGSVAAVTYTGREANEMIGFAAPTREGYEIEKDANGNNIWYKLNDDGSVDKTVTWVEGYYATAETDGLTFVPSWKGLPFTVNYYVEEGAELWDSEEVLFGNPIKGPFYEVEKTGYEFAGWQDAEGNAYVEGETPVPLGGIDLYATWVPGDVNFTVTIHYYDKRNNDPDKTVTRTGKAKTGSRVELVEAAPENPVEGVTYYLYSSLPAVSGYEFDETNENNEFVIESVNSEGKSVINVYYKASTITYTFDATEGGTFPSTGERYLASSGEFYDAFDVNSIEKPVKDGYVFKAWTPNANNLTVYNQNRTFTATWDVRKVNVTFNAGEGNFGTGTDGAEIKTSTAQLTHGSSITKPATNPTREGYEFLGWAATADGEVLTDLGTATDYDNGHNFYAKWKKASYGVTYLLDGALYGEVENVEYEGTVTVRDYPADIEGYTFVGWTYNGTTYAPGQTFTMPNGAVHLEGEFVADEFDAVFYATGGYFGSDETATTATVKVFYDDIGTSPAKPVRSGYEFLGYTDTEGSASIVLQANAAFTMNEEGKTYYAVWKATIADYTIEYYEMAVDGTYPAAPTSSTTRSGNVEGTVTAPVNVPTGFTLDEEDAVTAEKSILSGTVTPAPNNLVLKVYYSRNQYSVYTIVDGVKTEAGKFFFGADVTVADPPAKEGHTAVWSPAVTSPMEAQDQELTAVYTAINYTVTFISDGETVKSQDVAYGTLLSVVAPAPTKTGYTLDGWAYEGTTDKLDLTTVSVPVGGVTLTALWKINSNTVNFRANGGAYDDATANKSITVDYNAPVAAPEIPDRVGYTFTGWMDNATKIVYAAGTALPAMIDNVVNYVAQWQIETYTVNFVIDGTTISENYAFDADIEIPDETQTVKEGWTFKYWTDAQGNEVEPATKMEDIGDNGASITYTAYFEINSYKATFVSEGTTVEEKSYNYGAQVNKPATDPTKT
ncbi:MAG: InlB B-repeat-containing protein, partial [Acutalibacteraceae bacterium]|nr:InlB B-repeat-containing protein [Acutalibacteraceae bacterium]